jgi:RNA polymerase sigma factor (sigma-70 family)
VTGSTTTALSEEELADARVGFERYLRGKGFSRTFIAEHAEDLMGKANVELAKKMERGEEVRNAPGLLIHIAYRRTQNLLESRERTPDLVGLEAVGEVAAAEEQAPETMALDRDRVGKVRAAVSRLTVEERKIVALEFFEDMNLSQAARSLGWDESKARRRHKAAMTHLKDLLGVDSSDQIVFDVAFVCWLAVAFGDRMDFSLSREAEAAWQRLEDVGVSLVDRVQASGHRAHARLGGDPVAATAVSGAGRAAKVCGAAVICAIGAGAGVVVVDSHHDAAKTSMPALRQSHTAKQAKVSAPPGRTEAPVPAASEKQVRTPATNKHRPAVAKQRQQEDKGVEEAPAVEESTPAPVSQPPPSEVISTLEETNRPTSGTVEAHPSSAPDGSEVAEIEKAGGKTDAVEALETGRP